MRKALIAACVIAAVTLAYRNSVVSKHGAAKRVEASLLPDSSDSAKRVPDPIIYKGVWLNGVVAENHLRLERALISAGVKFAKDEAVSAQGPSEVVISIGTAVPIDQVKQVVTALEPLQDEYKLLLMIGSGEFERNELLYIGQETWDRRVTVPMSQFTGWISGAESTTQVLEQISARRARS